MTKLMKWLFCGILFLSVWLSLVTRKFTHHVLDEYPNIVLYFPIIGIFLFGVFAASTILWRIYTFNDCKEAALELKEQIEEAKTDLKRKGFKFEET